MILRAYWVGKSIVAAPDAAAAVQVLAVVEPSTQCPLADVKELSSGELFLVVNGQSSVTVGQTLRLLNEVCELSQNSDQQSGHGAVIRLGRPTS